MTKNIVAIILVFALLAGFAACRKIENDDFIIETEVYVTDEQGEKYDVLTAIDPSNGETHYYYINNSGETVTVDSNKVIIEENKVAPTTTTTLPVELQSFLDTMNDEEALDKLLSSSDAELEIAPDLIPDSGFVEEDVKVDSSGSPIHENVQSDPFNQISKGEKFTVEMVMKSTVDGTTAVVPMTYASDGTNLYIKMSAPVEDNKNVEFACILKDKTCWFLIPSMKAYTVMPADDADEMIQDLGSAVLSDDDDLEFVQSGSVDYNGVKYTVDVYKSKSSDTVIKKYYANGQLKRIEAVSGDEVSIVDITSISNTCDESLFNIPSGYIDLSAIIGTDIDLSSFS